MVDSDVVFQSVAPCEVGRIAHFRIFHCAPAQGGFVMFSVVSNMKTDEARNVTKDEKVSSFRKAALAACNARLLRSSLSVGGSLLLGTAGWARTTDLLIHSQAL
jgi:hypothetical protein